MPFAAYILFSPKLNRYYIGQAEDPQKRLIDDHNAGRNKSTKSGIPWEHRWLRWFDTRSEAMAIERAIKARKSRTLIDTLIREPRQADIFVSKATKGNRQGGKSVPHGVREGHRFDSGILHF